MSNRYNNRTRTIKTHNKKTIAAQTSEKHKKEQEREKLMQRHSTLQRRLEQLKIGRSRGCAGRVITAVTHGIDFYVQLLVLDLNVQIARRFLYAHCFARRLWTFGKLLPLTLSGQLVNFSVRLSYLLFFLFDFCLKN